MAGMFFFWLGKFRGNADNGLPALIGIGKTGICENIVSDYHIPAAAGFIPGADISRNPNGSPGGLEEIILDADGLRGTDQQTSGSAGTKMIVSAGKRGGIMEIFQGKLLQNIRKGFCKANSESIPIQ